MIPTDLISSWQWVEAHVIHYTMYWVSITRPGSKKKTWPWCWLAQQNLEKDRRPRKPKKKKEEKTTNNPTRKDRETRQKTWRTWSSENKDRSHKKLTKWFRVDSAPIEWGSSMQSFKLLYKRLSQKLLPLNNKHTCFLCLRCSLAYASSNSTVTCGKTSPTSLSIAKSHWETAWH